MTCLVQRGTWRLHTGTRECIHTADPDDTDEPALCADLFYVRVPVLGLNCCPLCAADDRAPRSRLTCLLTRELIISAIYYTTRHFLHAATFAAQHSAENRRRLDAEVHRNPAVQIYKKKKKPIFLLNYRKQNPSSPFSAKMTNQ